MELVSGTRLALGAGDLVVNLVVIVVVIVIARPRVRVLLTRHR
jgi:hypothetical protein